MFLGLLGSGSVAWSVCVWLSLSGDANVDIHPPHPQEGVPERGGVGLAGFGPVAYLKTGISEITFGNGPMETPCNCSADQHPG